jgi:hypothetical protein
VVLPGSPAIETESAEVEKLFRGTKVYCVRGLERGCARAVTGVKTEAAAEVASEEDLERCCCDCRSGGNRPKEIIGTERREKKRSRVWVAALVEKKKMRKRVATRSEGVVAAPKDEGRGVAEVDEEAQLVEGVSSLSSRAQTLILSKQGVHSKSSAAWPGRVIASHIPRSCWEIYRAQIGGMSQSKHTPRTSFPS